MNWMLPIILGITMANSIYLYVIYYYVNRNWEKLIDYQNQINQLDQTIYHTYNKRR